MHPAHRHPAQKDISLFLKPAVKIIAQFFVNVLDLFVRLKQKRQIQNPHFRQYLPQTHARKTGGMNLPDPHFADDILFISGDSARIKLESNPALGLFFDRIRQPAHFFHP